MLVLSIHLSVFPDVTPYRVKAAIRQRLLQFACILLYDVTATHNTMRLLVLEQCALAANIDAIQELADILVLHKAHLVDECARPADQLDVVSSKDELILGLRPLDRHASKHVYNAYTLLSQEVTDLHLVSLTLNVDVDGEMCVYATHLVFVALCGSSDHVLDMAAARADRGEALAPAEMAVHAKLLLAILLHKVHIHIEMLEVAAEGACN